MQSPMDKDWQYKHQQSVPAVAESMHGQRVTSAIRDEAALARNLVLASHGEGMMQKRLP